MRVDRYSRHFQGALIGANQKGLAHATILHDSDDFQVFAAIVAPRWQG